MVWFLFRVQEVPGSIPGSPLFYTSFFIFFIYSPIPLIDFIFFIFFFSNIRFYHLWKNISITIFVKLNKSSNFSQTGHVWNAERSWALFHTSGLVQCTWNSYALWFTRNFSVSSLSKCGKDLHSTVLLNCSSSLHDFSVLQTICAFSWSL